ncbi:uncharacterized protein LOC114160389 [Xiphophorus couchianus]|uniref:uncharacterized protein LOC114160389 n=1 Tax=Xiphophorus couchianus TaxID=32473 RepID=UPI0010167C1E|nr:uncharacterized protein LOC114160389 [Xiphophorus couchianus]
MAQLLLLDEQISNLLATDVGATGDDPTTLSRTDMSASQTGCPDSLQLGPIDSGLQTATPATDIPVQPTQTERGATDDQPPTASENVMNSRDTQHAERRDKNVQEETENISGSPPSSEVTPPLTLVLIGNKNSIDIGSKNILLDHDQEIHVKESRLYDLFGDQIILINMLEFPSIDTIPEIPEDCAFILLVSNDQQENQYTSGMQWLEETLGKEHSSYVMTVVTHDDSEEICENELQKLKAKSVFSEKRYHTCTRSMKDENEILDLLEKINDMVSENRRMTGGNQANLDETLKTGKTLNILFLIFQSF